MNILCLPKHGSRSASTRHRLMQYIPIFERAGHTVTIAPLLEDGYLDKNTGLVRRALILLRGFAGRLILMGKIRRYDLVWLYKEAFPYLPPFYEKLLVALRVPYVLDIDDAVYAQYEDHPNPGVRYLLRTKMEQVISNAKGVIVCNEVLATYVGRYNSNYRIVPTVVDETRFTPVGHGAVDDQVSVIGWIGSPSTGKYLRDIDEALHEVQEATSARVVIIGAGKEVLVSTNAEYRDWKKEREIDDIRSFSVGIMPLPNNRWSRGKCGFKIIEYLACGVPVVASPVGVNSKIVLDGEVGYLASNREQWVERLTALLEDKSKRLKFSNAGRKMIVERYGIESTGKMLLEFIGILDVSKW